MTKAATPSSSARVDIFIVTPLFDEYAILTVATTLPPDRVFPNSFKVCVVVLTGISVPSSGCSERDFASCSVASALARRVSWHAACDSLAAKTRARTLLRTCNALDAAQLHCLLGALPIGPHLLPYMIEGSRKSRDDIVA